MTPIIPRPVQGACDNCACIWNGSHGEPNTVDDWCTPVGDRCLCHSEEWMTLTYEQVAA